MANIDDGFRVEILSLNDATLIATGDTQPNLGGGYEAPQGSLYLRTNTGTDGEAYVKFGPNDVDWYELINSAQYQLLQNEVDNIELSLGSSVNTNGTWNGFSGSTNIINGATDITSALELLDAAASAVSSDDLASITLGLTTPVAIQTTWTNVSWEETHVENNTSILEHDNVNTDRVLIKETGLYLIAFSMSFDADSGEENIEGRVLIDDSTPVPGSRRTASEDDEVNDLSNVITAELTAGSYITFQTQASGSGNVLDDSSTFMVMRVRGTKGEKGDVGPPATSISLPAIQARRTSNFAVPTTWTDIDLDVTDIETDPNVIEHDNTNTDRFQIKEDGLYIITYQISVDADAGEETFDVRVRVNDSSVIPGSEREISEDDEINDIGNIVMANLSSGDFITYQCQSNGTGNVVIPEGTYGIFKAQGSKGDQGLPGIGSTIAIQEEGSNVPNGPFDTLNFIGQTITASDAGGGIANIVVSATPPKQYFHAHNGTAIQTLTTSFVTAFINSNVRQDSIYSNSNGEITVNKSGNFEVTYDISADSTGARSTMECVLQINGVNVPGSFSYGYHRNSANGLDTASATALVTIISGDVIRVRIREINGDVVTVPNASRLTIREID